MLCHFSQQSIYYNTYYGAFYSDYYANYYGVSPEIPCQQCLYNLSVQMITLTVLHRHVQDYYAQAVQDVDKIHEAEFGAMTIHRLVSIKHPAEQPPILQ